MSCAHTEAISPSHVRETNWHLRRDAQHYCSITRRRESNQLGRRESRAAADGSAGHCQFAIDCDSTRRLGLKTGRENPVPTGSVYRLNRP